MKSLSLSQPHAIMMVGIPGSGKSFFAEKFAATFSVPYISYHDIAQIVGSNDKGVVPALAYKQINELTKTRHSIVIEGGLDTRVERTELAKKLTREGYKPLLVWVQTDPATAKARTTKVTKIKKNRHLNEREHDLLARRFTSPHPKESAIVISGKHTYATQAKIVLKRLSSPRAEISIHSKPPTRQFSDIRRNR